MSTIKENKKAGFEFNLEQTLEVGIVLQGWEVKALRQGRLDFTGSYVKIINQQLVLLGAQIQPLISASTHTKNDPTRLRILLAKRTQIDKLAGSMAGTGKTLIALKAYWHKGHVKLLIALASAKNKADRRADIKEKDQKRALHQLTKQQLKDSHY